MRQLFRQNLLRQLGDAAPASLTVAQIALFARSAGFTVTEIEVMRELGYLEDKGFVAKRDQAISPEVAEWRITAPGRDLLAQEGLG